MRRVVGDCVTHIQISIPVLNACVFVSVSQSHQLFKGEPDADTEHRHSVWTNSSVARTTCGERRHDARATKPDC